jgi:hypothetical protein
MSVVVASIVGGGAALGSAAIGAIGAGNAASAQERATRDSLKMQQRMAREGMAYAERQAELSRKELAPFRELQLRALGQVSELSDPNSALARAERSRATEAVQRQLAAQGLLRSRAQGDSLANMELGFASENFNRQNALAGIGAAQGIAAGYQGLGQQGLSSYSNLGQSIGQTIQAGGAGQAQAYMAGANAIQGGFQIANNSFQSILGASQLNKLLAGSGGGGGYSYQNGFSPISIPRFGG